MFKAPRSIPKEVAVTLDLILDPRPHYTLGGSPIENGDEIEAFNPATQRWTRGKFAWTGQVSLRPWLLLATGYEFVIGEFDQVRRARVR